MRAASGRGGNAARADSVTHTSADKARRVIARNVKMAVGGGMYDVVRTYIKYVRNATGKWTFCGEDFDEADALAWLGPQKNPSIGRGTAHRDRVEAAIERRLRAQGEPKASARSRAYAIATAAELRRNPTPIDVASLDFAHFKRTTVIKGYYNVRTGRRFARVMSKDGTFVTDVPVADGGNDGHRVHGADAIKKRAYEQLRIHIQPATWKPSVRVNPGNAGSVRYGGTAIRIADGTYTVQPHGPSFSGPDGFVSAKKWIDTHGA